MIDNERIIQERERQLELNALLLENLSEIQKQLQQRPNDTND